MSIGPGASLNDILDDETQDPTTPEAAVRVAEDLFSREEDGFDVWDGRQEYCDKLIAAWRKRGVLPKVLQAFSKRRSELGGKWRA